MLKRGKDLNKLKEVFYVLAKGEKPSVKYKYHPLKDNKKGLRDLHIEPD
jgi:addiction module RelE/StbE family toxin